MRRRDRRGGDTGLAAERVSVLLHRAQDRMVRLIGIVGVERLPPLLASAGARAVAGLAVEQLEGDAAPMHAIRAFGDVRPARWVVASEHTLVVPGVPERGVGDGSALCGVARASFHAASTLASALVPAAARAVPRLVSTNAPALVGSAAATGALGRLRHCKGDQPQWQVAARGQK